TATVTAPLWRTSPAALLVCLAAPAFFVLELAWLGWVLLATGLAWAAVLERPGRSVTAGAVHTTAREGGRAPSLLRDLSLIALGMLVVSVISLEAKLDNLSMLRFTLALGGAVVLPYLVSRFVYRDRAISFPW